MYYAVLNLYYGSTKSSPIIKIQFHSSILKVSNLHRLSEQQQQRALVGTLLRGDVPLFTITCLTVFSGEPGDTLTCVLVVSVTAGGIV